MPGALGSIHAFNVRELSQNAAMMKNVPTYGVSQYIDGDRFVYWAAAEVSSLEGLPKEVKTMRIPAGKYARCEVPNLEKLTEAYMAVETWMSTQEKYTYNMQGVAFEEYKHGWEMGDSITIYIAVNEPIL